VCIKASLQYLNDADVALINVSFLSAAFVAILLVVYLNDRWKHDVVGDGFLLLTSDLLEFVYISAAAQKFCYYY
jgi:hypothetical protein